MRDLASVLSALADPTRLQMLSLLTRHEELCVCDFVAALKITQSKASRHLRYLWNARLLVDRREGLWVRYRITPELAPDSELLVDALRRVFEKRAENEADQRLEAWLSSKAGGARPVPEIKARAPRATSRTKEKADVRHHRRQAVQ
ncbi:MAG TPA: metalloregulator ArsR/SmtB family transcription factor [Myxococcales bacterium]|jgi:ArsR family transcriptional regulator